MAHGPEGFCIYYPPSIKVRYRWDYPPKSAEKIRQTAASPPHWSKFPPFTLLLGGGRRASDTGNMLKFTYTDDIKIKNEHVAGISGTFYLSTETISRPPQSH
jgi:hypothetical protein